MFTCMAETFVVVRCALFIELINLILWQIDHVRHIAHPIRKQLLSELQLLFDDTFKFVEEQFAGVIRSLVLQVIGERQSEAVMREHSWTSKRAITFVGISAKLDPIVTPKIDSFSSIWPIAESSVKGSRKGYNILPFVLHKLAHWDICVLQKTRTEHCRNVVKKIRDISHFHGEIALEHFLQTVSRFFVTRYTVPLLWSASVVIVHTVKIVIFIMVRKGCEQGSVIHPRNIDPIDTNFDVTEYRSGSSGHIIKIPVGFLVVFGSSKLRFRGIHLLLIQGPIHSTPTLRQGKSGTELGRVNIIPILNGDLACVCLNNVPKVPFQVLRQESLFVVVAFVILVLRNTRLFQAIHVS
mmetsp:Transcript_36376/g.75716  ORF Transcript_36376/g.75716 Transcript_36376/m.75716 type:complete len:353 (+) Transcript_36376:354-1412(+)